MNFKDIHIGSFIRQRVTEKEVKIIHICNCMKCTEEEIERMYSASSLDSYILLKWSKLLEYDFFRLYSQHLILYAPPAADEKTKSLRVTSLPQFRKNIYTKEVIDFILEQVTTGEMSKTHVIERYRIPKTTLYKWISKYRS